jgi:hypothetical protein
MRQRRTSPAAFEVVSEKPSFFFTARQKPAHAVLLPVCCLRHLFDARAPRLDSAVSAGRSCLVTRATFGWSLFGGTLAAAAADVTWRRAVALDLTLLFLDAAVLRFRDFAMEGVDIFRLRWLAALDLTLARPKHRKSRGNFARVFVG